MWLVVYAEDSDGTRTKLGEQHFGTVFEGADGTHPVEIWDAARVYSDERIPPRGTATSTYSFKMPADAQQVRILAVLDYRSLSPELADKAHVANPITTMASASRTVYANAALEKALEIPPARPSVGPRATIWTPILAALGFCAMAGVVSLGIMSVQRV